MRTGTVTEDTLPDLLRSLSQGRKNGVLRISDEDGVDVIFSLGRITSAYRYGSSVAQLVAEHISAGYPENFEGQKPEDFETLAELFELLSGSAGWNESLFAGIVKNAILDLLYSINFARKLHFEFRVARTSEVDKNFLPSISVGQLLLDMVSLAELEPRVLALESEDDGFVAVDYDESCGKAVSEEEVSLLILLQEPMSIEHLRSCSLLNRHTFSESFLALVDRKLIARADSVLRDQPGELESFSEEDMLAEIENSLAALLEEDNPDYVGQGLMDSPAGQPAEKKGAPIHRSATSNIREAREPRMEPVLENRALITTIYSLNSKILASHWAAAGVFWIIAIWCLLAPIIFWRSAFLATN